MMIEIDTNDTPATLRQTAAFLLQLAGDPPQLETAPVPATPPPAPQLETAPVPLTSAATVRVDHFGVPFDGKFCSTAQEPFTADGKWKRRRGVSAQEYDKWHATHATAGPAPTAEPTVDAAAAFAGEPANDAVTAPSNAGEFMVWISEAQAAGNITPDDVARAYGQAGLSVESMFPPNDEATIAANVATLYALLTQ